MKKSKKDKRGTAAAKIARKTMRLIVRVGDVLEAAAVAASQPSEAITTSPGLTPPVTSDASWTPAVPSASEAVADAKNGEAPSPVITEAPSPAILETPGPAITEAPALAPAAVPVVVSAIPVAASVGDEGARAMEAVDGYATRHNLRAEDMPARGTLVAALTRAMTEHAAAFTEAHVQAVIDEEMRTHFRALASGTGFAASTTTASP